MLSKNNFEKKNIFQGKYFKVIKNYLFASRIHKKLPIYFFCRPNPDAIAVDAFP